MVEDIGDEVERWLQNRTAIQRIAAPVRLGSVEGFGTLLIVAVLSYPEATSVLYLQENGSTADRRPPAALVMRDDQGNLYRWQATAGSNAGPGGQDVRFATFDAPVPADASKLYLYSLPFDQAERHTAADPLPEALTIPLH